MSERSLEDRLAGYGKMPDQAIVASSETSGVGNAARRSAEPVRRTKKADVKNQGNEPARGAKRQADQAPASPSRPAVPVTKQPIAAAASTRAANPNSTTATPRTPAGPGKKIRATKPNAGDGSGATRAAGSSSSNGAKTRRPIQWPRPVVPSLAAMLGGIGRSLIGSGLIILMFVGYQLWGTNLQEAQAQEALQQEFEESIVQVASDADPDVQALISSLTASALSGASSGEQALGNAPSNPLDAALAEVDDSSEITATTEFDNLAEGRIDPADDDPVIANSSTSTPAEADAPATTVAPTTTTTPLPTTTTEPPPPEVVERLYEILYKAPGEPMAVIKIPSINVTKTVIEGVSLDDLKKGPGHYENSPLPGEPGNAAIAGHRTTYGAPFHNVDKLNPGDDIFVTTVLGEAHYKVMGLEIVSPKQVEVLNDFGDNRLTLTACHPKYSARQRIIVTAELVSEPIILPELPAESATIKVTETVPATTTTAAPTTTTAAPTTTTIATTAGSEVAAATSVPVEQIPVEEVDEEDLGGVIAAGDSDPSSTTVDFAAETGMTELPNDAFDEEGNFVEGSVPDGAVDEDGIVINEEALSSDLTLDEGLGWDKSAIRPAVLWGLAAGLAFFVALLVGRVWESMARKKKFKRLFSYLVLSPVFFIFLWFSFYNVDRMLPAY